MNKNEVDKCQGKTIEAAALTGSVTFYVVALLCHVMLHRLFTFHLCVFFSPYSHDLKDKLGLISIIKSMESWSILNIFLKQFLLFFLYRYLDADFEIQLNGKLNHLNQLSNEKFKRPLSYENIWSQNLSFHWSFWPTFIKKFNCQILEF